MLAVLAIISALSGYAEYVGTGDVRWLIGGTIILASWPYAYFVMIPVNVLLYDARRNAPASVIRDLMRDWGLLEWGQTAIGLSAACMFGSTPTHRRSSVRESRLPSATSSLESIRGSCVNRFVHAT
jgi:hypothetical protein